MAEKIYDSNRQEVAQRDPAKRYKYTTVDGQNAYVELSAAETARRNQDAANHAAEQAKPRPPALEEQLAALTARLAALEARKP